MCKYIADAQQDPGVWAAAKEAQQWGSPVQAAFWWPKHRIRFVQDDALIQSLLNERDQLELLVTPPVMVRSSKPQGDCDDFTMMVCALLKVLGVGFEIVTVAADGYDPSKFSHVFCRAVLSDGSRIPLDASHGKYPGWCVPTSRTYRVQVWDEAGNPIADRGAKWNGLHGFVGAGRGVQGLGACLEYDDSGNCAVDDGATGDGGYQVIGPAAPAPNGTYVPPACPAGLTMLAGTCVIPGTTVTSSTAGGVNTTPGFSSALQAILAGITSRTGGQIASTLRPTVPAGSIAIPTNSLLLYGGLAVLGLFFIVAVSKK